MLLPVSMLRPFEFRLNLAAQAQFGVKNKGIKMATDSEQIIATAAGRAERGAWKLRMKSEHSYVREKGDVKELGETPRKQRQ